MATAKLFWSGNSQAVRLPKEFRFEGKMVNIRKQGKQVIIEPIVNNWAWVWTMYKALIIRWNKPYKNYATSPNRNVIGACLNEILA